MAARQTHLEQVEEREIKRGFMPKLSRSMSKAWNCPRWRRDKPEHPA
jgi:hypothetical protein